jgi:hypothetical protein
MLEPFGFAALDAGKGALSANRALWVLASAGLVAAAALRFRPSSARKRRSSLSARKDEDWIPVSRG